MPLDQVDVDKIGKEEEMSFLDHLEQLRWHLIRAIISIIVIGIVVFLAEEIVFGSIILAHKDQNFFTYQFFCGLSESLCFYPKAFKLETITLEEQFITHLKVSFILAFVVAFPYIFWEVWRFIRPGLYPEERKAARGIVFICSFLFLSGVAFGYFVIAPFAVTFLSNYAVSADVGVAPRLANYVNLIAMLCLPTGLVFEMPIVVYFFSKLGLLTPDFMRQYRRHAFIVILILAALITPPDVITQFLIGVPLFFLYEASILISARVYKQRQKEME